MERTNLLSITIFIIILFSCITSAAKACDCKHEIGNITLTETEGNTYTDYPIELYLTSENFNFSQTNTNGRDLCFFDGTNTLEYTVVYWHSTYKQALVKTVIPQVNANSTTTIKMYSECKDTRGVLEVLKPRSTEDSWIYFALPKNGPIVEITKILIFISLFIAAVVITYSGVEKHRIKKEKNKESDRYKTNEALQTIERFAKKTLEDSGKHPTQIVFFRDSKVDAFNLPDDVTNEEFRDRYRDEVLAGRIERYFVIRHMIKNTNPNIPIKTDPNKKEFILITEYKSDRTVNTVELNFKRAWSAIAWGKRTYHEDMAKYHSKWNLYLPINLHEATQNKTAF